MTVSGELTLFMTVEKWTLNFSSLADQMKKKIDMLPRPSGTTYGGLALKETFRILFNGHGNLNFECKLGK